jgi:hypothetical protein
VYGTFVPRIISTNLYSYLYFSDLNYYTHLECFSSPLQKPEDHNIENYNFTYSSIGCETWFLALEEGYTRVYPNVSGLS